MNTPTDVNDLRKEQTDILLGMYKEHRTHVRHLESQRSTASNIIILTTVGLVGFIAAGGLTCEDWPLSVALIILGLYGTMFTAIHYECIRHYRSKAGECCKALEVLLFKGEKSNEEQTKIIENILSVDDCAHEENLPNLRELPFLAKVRAVWPITISIIGLLITGGLAFVYFHGWCVKTGCSVFVNCGG